MKKILPILVTVVTLYFVSCTKDVMRSDPKVPKPPVVNNKM